MPTRPNQTAEQTLPSARWAISFRQEILDSLDLARVSDVQYIGGRAGVLSTNSGQSVDRFCQAAGWESAGPAAWRLPDGVYDMRQTLRYLAEQRGRGRLRRLVWSDPDTGATANSSTTTTR